MDNDIEYLSIIRNIIDNEEFKKIKTIEHHGTTRYEHSLRVSYYSYKIAKYLHLDYIEAARAGLLHDFFISKENRTKTEKFKSTFIHPKYSLENSKKYFKINQKEMNIIESHMFPIYPKLPRYRESWLVSSVDKVVGTYEFTLKFKYKVKYSLEMN